MFKYLSKAGLMTILYLLATFFLSAQAGVIYFHNDPVGSPLVATDEDGNIIAKETYYPYGERYIHAPGTEGNTVWFAGKSHDEDTELSYFGARYYSPVLGRFTGIDPVAPQMNNLHSLNRYAYANNNPYKYIDPDGRSAIIGDLGGDNTYDVSGDVDSVSILGAEVTASDIYLGAVTGVAGEFVAARALASSAVSRVSGFFGKLFNSGTKGGGKFTYRGDSRSPSEIFENGFTSRGSSTDLHAHALDNTNPASAFISTSKSADVAADFSSNVYVVRPRNGIDVNKALGSRSPFPDELEIAVPRNISPSDVRAVTRGNVSILNPRYKP